MKKVNRVATPKTNIETSGFARAMASENGKTNIEKIVNTYTTYSNTELKNIPINQLLDYPRHHYKAQNNEKFQNLCDSIERAGLYEPIIVNHIDGKYYILAGHNRRNALKAVYEKTNNEKFAYAPCLVKENLNETLCELIVQETNLTRRNFDEMDLQEKCENIHEYYDAVYNFYQANKNDIPKGFQTRQEVGSRLGMNYKVVEMYNRIYKTFVNNPEWYTYSPDYIDLSVSYELCKLDAAYIEDIFTELNKLRENNITKKIKLANLKNLIKQIDSNNLSSIDFAKQLIDVADKNNNANGKGQYDFKIPINYNSPLFTQIQNLEQGDMNILEIEIMNTITKYLNDKKNNENK